MSALMAGYEQGSAPRPVFAGRRVPQDAAGYEHKETTS